MPWTVASVGGRRCGDGHRVVATADPALAQGRLDARYAVTLGGVPVGKGAWVIDIAENQFTAAASGATAGLLRVFASGQGSGASRGYIVGGNPVPATFAASITSDKKTEEIRMTLGSGDVKEFAITPEVPDDPERVPVTDAHFHGVSDPMTGSLMRVPGTGNPLGAAGLPAHHADLRRPHALQSAVRLQAHGAGQGREGLRGPGGGLRGLFHRRSPATFRTAPRSSIWRASATWRSGWRRSAPPACWCRSGSRSRRRSASA